MANTYNYKLLLSYHGGKFSGFQCQPGISTVESVLTQAASKLFDETVNLTYSGRTDSGVHASKQVVVIKAATKRTLVAVQNGMNCYLPNEVQVLSVEFCDDQFHPRFMAKSRVYVYVFTNELVPFYLKDFVATVNFIPNMDKFSLFSNLIIGQHDFKYIRKTGSNENTTIRTIKECTLKSVCIKDLYDFEKFIKVYQMRIEGNAFLYRLVRNLVGIYFEFEKNKLTIKDIQNMLSGDKNRKNIVPAPSQGLSLVDIKY